MTVGSVFSGIGGLDLGLERAGHRILFQVESNAYARAVLARHWPTVPCYTDVTTLQADHLPPVDILCGGPPCTPVSEANITRKGTEDANWLWPHFNRLVRRLRPRYLLLENVPGLLTANRGGAFQSILSDLASQRYDAEWRCLGASHVGLPHRRLRVWLVAYPHDEAQSGIAFYDDTGKSLSEFTGRHERSNAQCEVDRVAHGTARWVERVRTLGSAVVPPMAEWLGHRLTTHATTRPR
jgi:DNA (cytosine-5)-methyltransferase 1